MGNSCESLRVQAVATNDSLELFKRTEVRIVISFKPAHEYVFEKKMSMLA